MAKTALNSDVKLKALQKQFESESEALGLLDDYLYVTQYRAYTDQLRIMDELKAEVTAQGVMMTVTAGRDLEKRVVNPAVSEYNRMAGLANKTASQVLAMLTKARESHQTDEEESLL